MERKHETKAVKQALASNGFTGISVGHGTGTAWGWLHIRINQLNCFSEANTRNGALRIAQRVTGRHGDYDGNINVYVNTY